MNIAGNYFLRFCLAVVFFVQTYLQATSFISTASGGSFVNGYKGQSAGSIFFADGDLIRGHMMFKGGFTVGTGGAATVTWDADGFVNGDLKKLTDNAWLSLSSDLRLGTTIALASSSSSGFIGNGKSIVLGGDLSISNVNYFISVEKTTPIKIDGQGHRLLVNNQRYGFMGRDLDGTPSSSNQPAIEMHNMKFHINNGYSTLKPIFNNFSQITLNSLSLYESGAGDYICSSASTYQVIIKGDVYFDGAPGSVLHFGNSDFTIDKNSTLHVGPGVSLVGIQSLTMADRSSVLHLNGCNFYIGYFGLTLKKGTLLFENKVRIFNTNEVGEVSNTNLAEGLILGDGTVNNNIDVRVLGSAYVLVDGGIKYNNA